MKQREVLTGLFLQPIQVMEEVARLYRKYVALAVVIWLISEFAGSYAFQEPFRTVFRGLIAMLIFAFWIYKVPFWFGGKTRLKNFITLYGLARLPFLLVSLLSVVFFIVYGESWYMQSSIFILSLVLFFISLIWNAVLLVLGIQAVYRLDLKDSILSYVSAIILASFTIGIFYGIVLLLPW